MPDFLKIPSGKDLVDNGEKAAKTYERNPTGSFVYIILVLCIGLCLYLGWQLDKLQTQLNEITVKTLEQAITSQIQEKTIQIQKEAMKETKTTLQDSIDVVNIRNLKQ